MHPGSYRQALWHGLLRVHGLKSFIPVCSDKSSLPYTGCMSWERGCLLSHKMPVRGTLVGQLCLGSILGCPLQIRQNIAPLHRMCCSHPALRAGLC